MRPRVIEAAKDKFGENVVVKSLVDLKGDEDEERTENILVIGTIFKQQERKPSILAELSEEAGVEFEAPHTQYTADTDTLVLEDESMRVQLECGDSGLQPGHIVNGVVLGVWGREERGGKFRVADTVFSKVPAVKTEARCEEEVSVVVMSGLELGGEDAGWVSAAQLAVDWVRKNLFPPD